MLEIVRTDSADPRFRALVRELDAELVRMYGDGHPEYAPLNLIASLPTVVIALDGARPVGCACFKHFGSDAVELKRMYVVPDARGRRIATQILDELEQWAHELGLTAMVLETGIKQVEAIAMYQRQGFARIDAFGPYVGMALSICMRKPLTPRSR